ncbi:MAG TPA: DEAD/DEAH box helicase, partial [Dehalococcoidia bacterium]|nr:DEAD/DEAH box helicase [Dehalococcoidia bacterium]
MTDFAELNLSDEVRRSLKEMGFEEPTPIQARVIPSLIQGRDVVAQALTGTGKTAAYGIPLVERLRMDAGPLQAIILAPTRELAVQVGEHLSHIGRHRGMRLVPIYGGQPIERQLRALRQGVHAVVATPGRLMDHMRRRAVDLRSVHMLILDEADQMLQMGFQDDVEYVMSHLPEERVTGLFSATMPKPILDIVHRYMRDPEIVRLSRPKA